MFSVFLEYGGNFAVALHQGIAGVIRSNLESYIDHYYFWRVQLLLGSGFYFQTSYHSCSTKPRMVVVGREHLESTLPVIYHYSPSNMVKEIKMEKPHREQTSAGKISLAKSISPTLRKGVFCGNFLVKGSSSQHAPVPPLFIASSLTFWPSPLLRPSALPSSRGILGRSGADQRGRLVSSRSV